MKTLYRFIKLCSLIALCLSSLADVCGTQITAYSSKTYDHNNLPNDSIENFAYIYSQILNIYVNRVDQKKLFIDAMRGMVRGLDPHSDILSPVETAEFNQSLHGEIEGVGIRLGIKNNMIYIHSIIPDSPASKSSLSANDFILKINDKSTDNMDLYSASKEIRGKPNSKVDLLIYRTSSKQKFHAIITRDKVSTESTSVELRKNNLIWLRIDRFNSNTTFEILTKLSPIIKKASGILIDLRNCPGGILDSSVNIASLFLKPNLNIVYVRNKIHNINETYISRDSDYNKYNDIKPILLGLPVALLVNTGTASAAEILTAALGDNNRAIIIGSRTFGKGSVQISYPIAGMPGYSLKLTTSLYYTPHDNAIQAKGIDPDIYLESTDETGIIYREVDLAGHIVNGKEQYDHTKNNHVLFLDYGSKNDTQLEQALNILRLHIIIKQRRL